MFEAIDQLEVSELYDDAIPVLTFFRYLRKLMDAAGYHDISMRVSDASSGCRGPDRRGSVVLQLCLTPPLVG